MKFIIQIEMDVNPMDVDIMKRVVPSAILDRFEGTAVRVQAITVTKGDPEK